ncbi:DnaJ-domain-containing protein [Periconia macrospinosa]|uniref:DnaJ-domain-containing protein n=1 Tax=Periconia macrospinosa TaxID=97972 RepID=A0A2V1E3P1_9PLEO|nr:DnaJ-domain-containing protein [Periconia macrospinosa]
MWLMAVAADQLQQPRDTMARSKAARAREEDPFINDEDEDIEAGEDGPPVINPYKVLELEKDATADDVKKAYRKMALKYHPDKVTTADKDAANQHFQEIAFAYAILSDTRRRKRYDLTGSTAEVLDDDDDFNWLSFYREQFAEALTAENITNFSQKYKGSDEERRDLLEAYTEHEGRLDKIYQTVMLSDVLEDDDRFRKIIDEEIAKGTVESYKSYERDNNDAARKKAKDVARKQRDDFDRRQAAEQEKQGSTISSKANGKPAKTKKSASAASSSMDDLAALIQQRQKARHGNFFDQLEAKYAPKQSSGRSRKRASPMDEPSEEAFAAMAARKKSKTTTSKAPAKKKAKAKEDSDVDMDESEDIGDSEDDEDEEEEVKPRKKKGRTLRKGRGRA